MKTNLFLLIIFTFICLNVKAQSYYPFPTDSATWTVVATAYAFPFPDETGTWHFGVSGDTVLNSINYHKIYWNSGSLGSINPDTAFNLATATYYAGFREDSTKKIWLIDGFPSLDTAEYLYYDFSLNVGDTFCFNFATCGVLCHPVSLVDSILINGSYRKQIHFSYEGSEEIWIEGIGSAYDNWYGEWCFIGNIASSLNCYIEYGVHIYGTCDYPIGTSINEISNRVSSIKLYPNPVANFLTIEKGVRGAKINIENLLGKNIFTQTLATSKSELNLEFLPNGIYVLHYKEGAQESTFKLVKQ